MPGARGKKSPHLAVEGHASGVARLSSRGANQDQQLQKTGRADRCGEGQRGEAGIPLHDDQGNHDRDQRDLNRSGENAVSTKRDCRWQAPA